MAGMAGPDGCSALIQANGSSERPNGSSERPLAQGAPRQSVLWSMTIAALLCLALAAVGLREFLSSAFAVGAFDPPGFTPSELLGLAAWSYLFPLAVVLITINTPMMLKRAQASRATQVLWLAALGGASVASVPVGIIFARDVLRCGIFFCSDDPQASTRNPKGIFVSMGLWIILVAVCLATAFFGAIWSLSGTAEQTLEPMATRLRGRRRRRCWASALLAAVVIPGCFLLTTILPNTVSKMSAIPGYMASRSSGAEVAGAWMRTHNVELSSRLVLKLFPDVAIFYGFLEVLAIASILAAAFPAFGKLLATTCFRTFRVGECLAGGCLTCMLFLWGVYWLHDHAYGGGNFDSRAEVAARSAGVTAVLFMGLSLLPAAKNSLWLTALGISWESSLWVHRGGGILTLLFTATHILAFWVDFAVLGIFPHDILAIPTFYPMNGPKPSRPTGDDWTVPLMQLVAYPSLLALGLPQLWRRRHWEIFKYFHYVFMALVPATLLHAASGWYYLMGSVAFWLVDATIRFIGTAQQTPVLSVAAHEAAGVTEVRFAKAFEEPGQYCFVNIPEISVFEWHPFSLCSSPQDGFAQMCIKDMGPGTFTGRLLALARQASAHGSSFTLNVDGPYGPALDPGDFAAILLLAGGIGITPMHSTLRMLAQLAERRELPSSLRLIRLVWVGRSMDLFRILAGSLSECVRPGRVEVVLYLDDPSGPSAGAAAAEMGGLPVSVERPSFDDVYDAILRDVGDGGRVLVKACGPPPMDKAAQAAASGRAALAYESELFVL